MSLLDAPLAIDAHAPGDCDTPVSVLDIPPELLDVIADHLVGVDVVQLAAACHTLSVVPSISARASVVATVAKQLKTMAKPLHPSLTSSPYFEIPQSIQSIGELAFHGHRLLTVVTLPSSIRDFGPAAFAHCTALTTVQFHDDIHLTSIPHHTFDHCISLRTLKLPACVTRIDHNAFYGCAALETFHLPASITSIGKDAFQCCFSLTKLTFPPLIGVLSPMVDPSAATLVFLSRFSCIASGAFQFCPCLDSTTKDAVRAVNTWAVDSSDDSDSDGSDD